MKFNSKTLQARFDELKPLLERLQPDDALAEDIRELERFFRSLKLRESFSIKLNFMPSPANQKELLLWDHKSQGLCYVKNRYGMSCHAHDKGYYPQINYNDKEIVIELPLLDAPNEVKQKIAAEDKLALFLSLFSQRLNAQQRSLFYFN